jgi:hypothetical protein
VALAGCLATSSECADSVMVVRCMAWSSSPLSMCGRGQVGALHGFEQSAEEVRLPQHQHTPWELGRRRLHASCQAHVLVRGLNSVEPLSSICTRLAAAVGQVQYPFGCHPQGGRLVLITGGLIV